MEDHVYIAGTNSLFFPSIFVWKKSPAQLLSVVSILCRWISRISEFGEFLAVSRSFGDKNLKSPLPLIISTPEIEVKFCNNIKIVVTVFIMEVKFCNNIKIVITVFTQLLQLCLHSCYNFDIITRFYRSNFVIQFWYHYKIWSL